MGDPYLAYAGIGARATPEDILFKMRNFATNMEMRGWTLRSGGAEGADRAFESGVYAQTCKEIFLPWPRYNGNSSDYTSPLQKAMEIAESFHPAWNSCKDSVKLLHARNVHQILGSSLKSPSKFVICWTPNGQMVGGTAQALRIATHYNIPIFNLGDPDFNWDINKQITELEK